MEKNTSAPLEKLFGSKTRTKLLALFFESPQKSFFVREITRVIDEQINSVRRELLNLDSLGIIRSETFENKVYYTANSKHVFFRPLVEIFSKRLVISKDNPVVRGGWDEYIKPVKKYLRALLITNRAPGQDGLDMLIIGDDRTRKLTRWAEVVEKKEGRPLNYAILSNEDFTYRKSVRDKFLLEVFELEVDKVIDPEKILLIEEK
jgi:hypothetical protein